ncbi:MAG TPA: hypothetical protein VK203_03085 [Nostocaceae cyanobacterium]|nr:hypothetical protein [Nostocaceae cyanobacterium]
MGRWGDGEVGRWGDGGMGRLINLERNVKLKFFNLKFSLQQYSIW